MISYENQYGDTTFVTVTDTGFNHLIENIPNQDTVDYMALEDDFVLALSDGVGSCIKAKVGSEAAVKSAKKVFFDIKETKKEPDLYQIVNWLINEWKLLLNTENLDDCCATLNTVMKFGNRVQMFSVGDGFIAVTSDDIEICSPKDNTLFANQTLCLCEAVKVKDFWTMEKTIHKNNSFAIFVCSDGVANGIQEGRELELVKEIETKISPKAIKQELESLVLDISEFSADDRTVGVVKYERKNEEFD